MQPQVLWQYADGDSAVFLALGEIFLRTAPDMFGELQAACEASDMAGVRAASHRLRGSTVLLGASRVSGLLAECEVAALAGGTPHLLSCMRTLQALFPALLAEMAHCQAHGGGALS